MQIHDRPFARKLTTLVSLSPEDLAAMSDVYMRRGMFTVGCDMVHQGQTDQAAYIIASGWVCSYKLLPSGTRQNVDFQIPGDILGLRSVLFRTAGHNAEPVTPVEASKVLAADLLADALGLSAVHINRVLCEWREAGLVTFHKSRVGFDDFAGLVAFADFDRACLDHDGPLLR